MSESRSIVVLVANGIIEDYDLITSLIPQFSRVIAVDGGLIHCQRMGVMPHVILGDLDSIPSEVLKLYSHLPIKKFPVEKDETDLEIALRLEIPNASKIIVLGAVGGRADHTFYNLNLLDHYCHRVIFETEKETLFAISEIREIACKPGQVISLLPMGEGPRIVTTQGLHWELSNAHLSSKFMSLSNKCLADKVKISVIQGSILCCLART